MHSREHTRSISAPFFITRGAGGPPFFAFLIGVPSQSVDRPSAPNPTLRRPTRPRALARGPRVGLPVPAPRDRDGTRADRFAPDRSTPTPNPPIPLKNTTFSPSLTTSSPSQRQSDSVKTPTIEGVSAQMRSGRRGPVSEERPSLGKARTGRPEQAGVASDRPPQPPEVRKRLATTSGPGRPAVPAARVGTPPTRENEGAPSAASPHDSALEQAHPPCPLPRVGGGDPVARHCAADRGPAR